MTLISKIEGPIAAAELMIQLNTIIAENEHDLVAARLDRETRSQTQMIRQQQDEAYLESLKVDQEKAKLRQKQVEENRRAEEIEKQKIAEEKVREDVSIFIKTEFWNEWIKNFK